MIIADVHPEGGEVLLVRHALLLAQVVASLRELHTIRHPDVGQARNVGRKAKEVRRVLAWKQ